MVFRKDLLEKENKRLSYILQHHQQLAMNGNVREMELGYHQKDSDFHHSQMPMAFRVQSIQPNLQEDKHLGATIYASRFAVNALRALRRNGSRKTWMQERLPMMLLQKPAEPEFTSEER